jgi:hypothetical protein
MNSIGGGDHSPFDDLPRWRQLLSIVAAVVFFPLGIVAAIVFATGPLVGVWVGVSGQPSVGIGIVAVGLATWFLSWLLLGL